MGYSPWGCKKSDTTELLTHTNSLYLLIPNSKFIPPLSLFPFGNHNFFFLGLESASVSQISSFV